MIGKAKIKRKGLAVLSGLALAGAFAVSSGAVIASAEEVLDVQTIVTDYSDLWTGTISAKVGETVKWYVLVPEETVPKGCGATIKIPDLGWGTDTHNKEEGHLTLTAGENFVYEFTPEETGDILFTCWMGSGCHHNYIHITEDGSYSVPAPGDPVDISAVWEDDKAVVSFTPPEAPEGSVIKSYKATAAAEDGTKKKASATESPIIIEGLDKSKSYTISVSAIGTSGNSAGENTAVLSAVNTENSDESSEIPDTNDNSSVTDNTSSETSGTDASKTDTDHSSNEASGSSGSSGTTAGSTKEEQIIRTPYSELWTGNITVKQGVRVKWYVDVSGSDELLGCTKTIKIPGLGWGTDTHNKEEGHLTLTAGENFVYEFTPENTEDILFTCWMGSGCHYNYIHVTADGKPDPGAVTGGKVSHTHEDEDAAKGGDKHTAGTGSTSDKDGTGASGKYDLTDVKFGNDGGSSSSGAKTGTDTSASSDNANTAHATPAANVTVSQSDSGNSAGSEYLSASVKAEDNPHTGSEALPVALSTVFMCAVLVLSRKFPTGDKAE